MGIGDEDVAFRINGDGSDLSELIREIPSQASDAEFFLENPSLGACPEALRSVLRDDDAGAVS